MQIADIEHVRAVLDEHALVTFADDEGKDIIKIKISKNDIWQLVDFARDNMSYAAQLKRKP